MNNTETIKKEFEQRPLIFENRISTGLLTIEELSIWLNLPVKALYKKIHIDKIPHIKIGRLLRFNRSEIEAWLQERSTHVY